MSRKYLTLVSGATAISLFFFVKAASAHSQPIRFDPPPGASLSSAPARIDGWFTSPVRRDPNWTFMQVRDSQGNRVDQGETILSPDRRQVRVNLWPNLPSGRFVVTRRVWDDEDNAAFADRLLLSGGNGCECFEVSASDRTPVPGASFSRLAESERDENGAEAEGYGNGLSAWVPLINVGAGLSPGAGIGTLLPGGHVTRAEK